MLEIVSESNFNDRETTDITNLLKLDYDYVIIMV